MEAVFIPDVSDSDDCEVASGHGTTLVCVQLILLLA